MSPTLRLYVISFGLYGLLSHATILHDVDPKQIEKGTFEVAGWKPTDEDCTLDAIIKNYAKNVEFVRTLFPENRKKDVRTSDYNKVSAKNGTMIVTGQDVKGKKKIDVLKCQQEVNPASVLSCTFSRGMGAATMHFTLSRTKEDGRCIEQLNAEGKFTIAVHMLGYNESKLAFDVAKVLIDRYRGGGTLTMMQANPKEVHEIGWETGFKK